MTSKLKIGLLNYGAGNMASIRNALEYINRPYDEIISGPLPVSADYIFILPGVGSFAEASNELQSRAFDELSRQPVKLIGICLGMQLLFSDSTEGHLSTGLGLIPGRIRPIKNYLSAELCLPIPHVGWRELTFYSKFEPFPLSSYYTHDFYFTHSYMAADVDSKYIIATVDYGGISIPAIVSNKSAIGLQFHPEKSGLHGLQLLDNVISYLDKL
jgi:glutamine amidotransferase